MVAQISPKLERKQIVHRATLGNIKMEHLVLSAALMNTVMEVMVNLFMLIGDCITSLTNDFMELWFSPVIYKLRVCQPDHCGCSQWSLKCLLFIYDLELQRKAESYFQHTIGTFSSDTRQSMKRQIVAKHLIKPK